MATLRRSRHVIAAAVFAVTLTGCFTGERPSFGCGAAESTGRAEIDDVLTRLECVAPTPFTADYTILTRLGDITSTATVVQTSGARRSVTINSIRYINDDGRLATCDLTVGTCEATINEARISNLQLTSEFYGRSMAARLRADADRRIGDPVASTMTHGGQSSLCVDIPVTGGVKRYCVLDSGILALFDANDLHIELTSYSPTPDESAFETS